MLNENRITNASVKDAIGRLEADNSDLQDRIRANNVAIKILAQLLNGKFNGTGSTTKAKPVSTPSSSLPHRDNVGMKTPTSHLIMEYVKSHPNDATKSNMVRDLSHKIVTRTASKERAVSASIDNMVQVNKLKKLANGTYIPVMAALHSRKQTELNEVDSSNDESGVSSENVDCSQDMEFGNDSEGNQVSNEAFVQGEHVL